MFEPAFIFSLFILLQYIHAYEYFNCTGPLACDQNCASLSNSNISYFDGPYTGTCSALLTYFTSWGEAYDGCSVYIPAGMTSSLVSITSLYVQKWMLGKKFFKAVKIFYIRYLNKVAEVQYFIS